MAVGDFKSEGIGKALKAVERFMVAEPPEAGKNLWGATVTPPTEEERRAWAAQREEWARLDREKQDSLKGKVLASLEETGSYSGEVTLTFTDGTKLVFSADEGVSWDIEEAKHE